MLTKTTLIFRLIQSIFHQLSIKSNKLDQVKRPQTVLMKITKWLFLQKLVKKIVLKTLILVLQVLGENSNCKPEMGRFSINTQMKININNSGCPVSSAQWNRLEYKLHWIMDFQKLGYSNCKHESILMRFDSNFSPL